MLPHFLTARFLLHYNCKYFIIQTVVLKAYSKTIFLMKKQNWMYKLFSSCSISLFPISGWEKRTWRTVTSLKSGILDVLWRTIFYSYSPEEYCFGCVMHWNRSHHSLSHPLSSDHGIWICKNRWDWGCCPGLWNQVK